MSIPNIANTATLNFKVLKGELTTAAATLVNNAVSSNYAVKICSLYVANIDGTNSATMTISVYSQDDIGGTATHIAYTVTVPAKSTIVVIDEESPIFLEEDMSLGGLASANSDLSYVVSYQIIDDA